MARSLVLMVILVAGLVSFGNTAIPDVLNYQGVLTNAGAAAVPDGPYEITFRIYSVASGGSPLWEETQANVQVTKGIFDVMLGSVVTLDLPFNTHYYLGISVEGEAELNPRIELSAAAYSFTAKGTFGDANTFTSNGNVGIGILTPIYPLTIIGPSDKQVGIIFHGHNSGYASIYVDAAEPTATAAIGYARGPLRAMTLFDTNDYFRIRIDGTNHVNLSPAGNLGVGVAAPLERLDVAGALRLGTTANNNVGTIRWSGTDFEGYNGSIWQSFTGGGSGSLPPGSNGQTLRHDGSNWNPTSNLYNNGTQIGIGTTSPEENVHVKGPDTQQLRIETVSTIGRSDLELKTTGGTTDYLMLTKYAPSAGGTTAGSIPLANLSHIFSGTLGGSMLLNVMTSNPIYFATNNLERMRLDASGYLGIHTTAPDAYLHVGGDVKIGTGTQDGSLEIYRSSVVNPMIRAYTTSLGGDFEVYDELGNTTAALDHDANGEGGYFYVKRDPSFTAFRVDGNYNGTGDPVISMYGSSSSMAFNPGTIGNASVQLPINSISSAETENEAGVASYAEGVSGVALGATIGIIASRSIATPAAGCVMVVATCQTEIYHINGTFSSADLGVSDESGAFPSNQDVWLRLNNGLPSGYYDLPITCHGLFQESVSGMHTYYLLGRLNTGDINIYDVQLTCIYIPTAYGTVDPTLSGGTGTDADATIRPALSASDVAAERAASEEANLARIERELAELRGQLEALKLTAEEK